MKPPYRPHYVERAALLGLVAWMALGSTGPAEAQRIERRNIELNVGEQTSISGENVANYSEGAPGIVDVRVSTVRGDVTRFVIVALRPGPTTLLLIMNNGRQVQYRIQVRDPEAEPTGIQIRDNIRLDLYFVQLSESGGHQIGIAWPTTFGGDGVASFAATIPVAGETMTAMGTGPAQLQAAAVITGHPLPRLDLLQTSGWARVMRHVSMITANANTARFSSGDEINIPIVGSQSAELRQIFFGSTVEVLPRYDTETSRIELRVNASVSNITDSRGTGVPGRQISESETLVNLEMGQAVVLGGLVAESESRSRDGLAGLSQIPFLGVLFGTHARRREASQNALFIVPSVVDVVDQQARRQISSALQVFWNYDGNVEDHEMLRRPAGIPRATPLPEDNAGTEADTE